MGRVGTAFLRAGLGVALGIAPVASGSAQEITVNPFAMRLLAAHNAERSTMGVAPLAWSDDLAKGAKAWSEHLAQQGRMVHATREQRQNQGENLWMGAAGYYSAEFMVGAFIDEKKYFKPGTFPDVSTTGEWGDVGHYTQVIWGETRQVGCAVTRNSDNDFLVCRYWPAGNWYWKPVF